MNWNLSTTIAIAAAAALTLAGCHPRPTSQAPNPAVFTAKQVCEIDTLAREHEVVVTRLGLEKDSSDTIAWQKLKEYRAEVDASYRFVVQNCNNYNMCMQAHGYIEPACQSSQAAWAESHTKFNELTSRLAEIEAYHHRPGSKPGKPRPSNGCSCDEVFTTGCCNENY